MAVELMRSAVFFFKPSDYVKACKLQTRCHKHVWKFWRVREEMVQQSPTITLSSSIIPNELFLNKKGDGNVDVAPLHSNYMQGLKILVEVNGVPIWYSIGEYDLISGLYCHQYPSNYLSSRSTKFVKKHFQKKVKKTKDKKKPEDEKLEVTAKEVEEKLKAMKSDGINERLKMAVL